MPPALETAIRKAAWRLVPLIALGYGAAYMDRVNISFAAPSMNRDLGFTASMYGFGAGIFFLSYALCEIPSNLLLVRFGARRWLARIMLTWGLLAMGTLFVRTAHEFYAMRFLLGIAEAGFFPGVVFYLTEWFPPAWRARVIARFYIALPLSSTVMGSLAGWLLGLNGKLHLRGWQWLFLVEGLPPLVLSACFYTLLPDTPADAAWLTPTERHALLTTLAESRHDHAPAADVWQDLRTALTDVRVLLLGAFFLAILTVLYGWAFSAPSILQGLTGWTIGQVGWLVAAMGLLGAAAMLLTARSSDRSGERYGHIIVPCLVMGVAFAVGGTTQHAWLAVPAFALTVMAYNASQGPVLALPAVFLSGRASAVGYAAITAIGVAGGFLGPYWMGRAKDWTGSYRPGLIALALPSIAAAALAWWLQRIATSHPAVQKPRSLNMLGLKTIGEKESITARDALGFSRFVVGSFRFLVDKGFRIVEEETKLVVYQSSTVQVSVSHGRMSLEIGVTFRLLGSSEGYISLVDVVEAGLIRSSDGDTEARGGYQTSNVQGVEEFIGRLATLVRDHCVPFLEGNRAAYSKMYVLKHKWNEVYTRSLELRQIRTRVERAWRERNFDLVAEALAEMQEDLKPSERLKLEYARKRRGA